MKQSPLCGEDCFGIVLFAMMYLPLPEALSARFPVRRCDRVFCSEGKKTGDGAPEGLPLIFRFFPTLTLSFGHPSPTGKGAGVKEGLTPSCDGEPLSSSTPRYAGSVRCLSREIVPLHLQVKICAEIIPDGRQKRTSEYAEALVSKSNRPEGFEKPSGRRVTSITDRLTCSCHHQELCW